VDQLAEMADGQPLERVCLGLWPGREYLARQQPPEPLRRALVRPGCLVACPADHVVPQRLGWRILGHQFARLPCAPVAPRAEGRAVALADDGRAIPRVTV